MITIDTAGPVVVAGLGFVTAVIAPEMQIPIDSTAIAGGGVGVALLWIARSVFRRVDDLITVIREVADTWSGHVQRTENIHRGVGVLLEQLNGEPGAPRLTQSMQNDITPRPVTIRDRGTRTRSTDS